MPKPREKKPKPKKGGVGLGGFDTARAMEEMMKQQKMMAAMAAGDLGAIAAFRNEVEEMDDDDFDAEFAEFEAEDEEGDGCAAAGGEGLDENEDDGTVEELAEMLEEEERAAAAAHNAEKRRETAVADAAMESLAAELGESFEEDEPDWCILEARKIMSVRIIEFEVLEADRRFDVYQTEASAPKFIGKDVDTCKELNTLLNNQVAAKDRKERLEKQLKARAALKRSGGPQMEKYRADVTAEFTELVVRHKGSGPPVPKSKSPNEAIKLLTKYLELVKGELGELEQELAALAPAADTPAGGAAPSGDGQLKVTRVHANEVTVPPENMMCLTSIEREIADVKMAGAKYASMGRPLKPEEMKVLKPMRARCKDLETRKCALEGPLEGYKVDQVKAYVTGVAQQYRQFRKRRYESMAGSRAEGQMEKYMDEMRAEITQLANYAKLDIGAFKLDEPEYVYADVPIAADAPPAVRKSASPPAADTEARQQVSQRRLYKASDLECMSVLISDITWYQSNAAKYPKEQLSTHIGQLTAKATQQSNKVTQGSTAEKKAYLAAVQHEYGEFGKRRALCRKGSPAEEQMNTYMEAAFKEIQKLQKMIASSSAPLKELLAAYKDAAKAFFAEYKKEKEKDPNGVVAKRRNLECKYCHGTAKWLKDVVTASEDPSWTPPPKLPRAPAKDLSRSSQEARQNVALLDSIVAEHERLARYKARLDRLGAKAEPLLPDCRAAITMVEHSRDCVVAACVTDGPVVPYTKRTMKALGPPEARADFPSNSVKVKAVSLAGSFLTDEKDVFVECTIFPGSDLARSCTFGPVKGGSNSVDFGQGSQANLTFDDQGDIKKGVCRTFKKLTVRVFAKKSGFLGVFGGGKEEDLAFGGVEISALMTQAELTLQIQIGESAKTRRKTAGSLQVVVSVSHRLDNVNHIEWTVVDPKEMAQLGLLLPGAVVDKAAIMLQKVDQAKAARALREAGGGRRSRSPKFSRSRKSGGD